MEVWLSVLLDVFSLFIVVDTDAMAGEVARFFPSSWRRRGALIFSVFTSTSSLYQGKVTWNIYMKKILPLSLFFAAGLALGNSAYKYISVAYIQMLKSFTPVPMLCLAYILGRETPSIVQTVLVLVISFGVAMTSVGEVNFSLLGFILQISAILADVSRTTLMDLVLVDLQLDSLSMLYYMQPPSFVFIGIAFYFFEYENFPTEMIATRPGFALVLLANGLLAFLLNVSHRRVFANDDERCRCRLCCW